MSIKSLTPYLYFDGTAEKAIKLYERALGAKVEGLMRYGDGPSNQGMCAPEDENRIMHAMVRVGAAQMMASDTPAAKAGPVGHNVQICIEFEDARELDRAFDVLAAGGKVTLAPHETFFAARFAMLIDEVGVGWILNCPKKPQ